MLIRTRILILWAAVALFALARLAGTAQRATPTVTDERARAVAKIAELNRWGAEAQIVEVLAGHLDRLIEAGADGEILIGWGLTRDRRAYRFRWTNGCFSFGALTPEVAAAEDFAEMSMTVRQSTRPAAAVAPRAEEMTEAEAFERGHRYHISEAILGEPPATIRLGEPLHVRARLARAPEAKGNVALELKWSMGNGWHAMYAYPDVTPGPEPQTIAVDFTAFAGKEPDEAQLAEYRKGVPALLRVVSAPKPGLPARALSNVVAVSICAGG